MGRDDCDGETLLSGGTPALMTDVDRMPLALPLALPPPLPCAPLPLGGTPGLGLGLGAPMCRLLDALMRLKE